MKKVLHITSIILQYIVTVFLGLMTLAGFIMSFPSGLMLLIATLLACPFTRNKGYGFIQNKFKLPMDKIKGWIIIPILVLFVAGITSAPTVEDTTNSQVAEAENMVASLEEEISSVETVPTTEEQIESVEPSTEAIAESVEAEKVVETTETIIPTESIIEETTEETVEESIPETTEEVEVLPTVSDMEVHFIDVGQGDATLIKADEHYMLIDAGDNSKGTTVQLYLQKQGIEKLDYLILTHTDSDHIGGTDVIVSKFDIDTVFMGDFKKDNDTYAELMNAFDYKGLTYSIPSVGSEYQLGNATFTILAPNRTYDNPNDSSIALVLKNGDNSFMFTGDCEEQAETDILSNGISVDCDVYKVGHHGSKSSSSQAFLNAITPIYGVISCEEGNSYGHPHAEPLNNLRAMGVKIFRTDEQGSIIAYSDGTEITWNCAPSETWQAGESTESASVSETTPTVEPIPESTPVPTPEPEPTPEVQEPVPETPSNTTGSYAVNGNNGKIHMVGDCPATGNGKNAMKNPIYFNTYEEAEAYSISIAPGQDKRKCGNCW